MWAAADFGPHLLVGKDLPPYNQAGCSRYLLSFICSISLLLFMLPQKTCYPTLQDCKPPAFHLAVSLFMFTSVTLADHKTQLRQDVLWKDTLTLHLPPLPSQAGLGVFASCFHATLVSHSSAGPCWTKRYVHVSLHWDMVEAQ